ncbi:MAG: 2-oxoacid:acceptor oxidoreductase family protein [Pseudomonadota bacterium]
MHREVTIAGFGGQGILLTGKLLAHAGLDEGREVVWLPSYGPEMRGGTAYCNVVISDQPIGSPVFQNPTAAVVMNRPSLDKFGPRVKPGGVLIINTSLIDVDTDRTDIQVHHVACNDIAMEEGTGKAANMVALGAYLGLTHAVKLETVHHLIKETFGHKPKIVDINLRALQRGHDAVQPKA